MSVLLRFVGQPIRGLRRTSRMRGDGGEREKKETRRSGATEVKMPIPNTLESSAVCGSTVSTTVQV